MKEEDAKALGEKAYAAMVSALQLADVPMLNLHLPKARTEAHKAEVERLNKDYQAVQGSMDRYLDSRDTENDDTSKEIVLTPARQEILYTTAPPTGAPEIGDNNDRS